MCTPNQPIVNRGQIRILAITLFSLSGLLIGPTPAQADVRESIKRALPATVGVEWRDAAGNSSDQISLASGTIVSADGLIVSTIDTAEPKGYSVTLTDGRVFEGRMLVDDRRTRLKLLKINATDLPFLTICDDPLQIGEDIATTTCDDLTSRVAARGIVAAKDRELEGLADGLVQLDLSVGPIGGGSPVVDDQGRLRGIIAVVRTGTASSFAVTTTQIQSLLQTPRGDEPTVIQRGRFGIIIRDEDNEQGHAVAHPVPDSPAAKAGLQEGDWMLSLDGKPVKTVRELYRLLNRRAAGETVRMTIRRGDQEQELTVKLAPAPEDLTTERHGPRRPLRGRTSQWRTVQPAHILIVGSDNVVRTVTGEPAQRIVDQLEKGETSATATELVLSTDSQTPTTAAPLVVQVAPVAPSESWKPVGQPAVPKTMTRPGPMTDGPGPGNIPPVSGAPAVGSPKLPDTAPKSTEAKKLKSVKVVQQPVQTTQYLPNTVQYHQYLYPSTTPTQTIVTQNVPSVRIERTDLDKRLEQMHRDLQDLKQQIKKLTDEIALKEKAKQ